MSPFIYLADASFTIEHDLNQISTGLRCTRFTDLLDKNKVEANSSIGVHCAGTPWSSDCGPLEYWWWNAQSDQYPYHQLYNTERSSHLVSYRPWQVRLRLVRKYLHPCYTTNASFYSIVWVLLKIRLTENLQFPGIYSVACKFTHVETNWNVCLE